MAKILKYFALLAMAVVLTSCDGPVGYAIHAQKIDNHMRRYNINEGVDDDTIRFVINDRNQILMKAEINGEEDTVIYDSGAASAVFKFFTEATKPKGMKFYRVDVTGADKKTESKVTMIPVKITTPMCIVEHLGNVMLMPENHICDKEPSVSRYSIVGFPGLDISSIAIDFTKKKIYNVEKSQIDTVEYIPVKCRVAETIYTKQMFVYPVINGVEYECIFDTGNGGGILIQDAQKVGEPSDADMLYEGSYGIAIGGAAEMQQFVIAPENTVEFAGQTETIPVMYLEGGLAFNNMGLAYIKRFDWIITSRYDESTEGLIYKMYAKPHVSDTMDMTRNRYGISTSDGTLRILARLIDGNEKYKVGDQIISVNGEKISEENICHYYDLLTENKDWSGFEIRVK